MKMRATMTNGAPITFEMIDLGGTRYERTGCTYFEAPYTTDFVGEGFYVRSTWDGLAQHLKPDDPIGYHRVAFDRQSLERAGVDTATVEQWDPDLWVHVGGAYGRGGWHKVWPRRSDLPGFENVDFTDRVTQPLVDKVHDLLMTTPMVHAGAATLHDVVQSLIAVDKGQLYVTNPHRAVTLIWRAMVAAWQRGG